jgi:hypothetical protein
MTNCNFCVATTSVAKPIPKYRNIEEAWDGLFNQNKRGKSIRKTGITIYISFNPHEKEMLYKAKEELAKDWDTYNEKAMEWKRKYPRKAA